MVWLGVVAAAATLIATLSVIVESGDQDRQDSEANETTTVPTSPSSSAAFSTTTELATAVAESDTSAVSSCDEMADHSPLEADWVVTAQPTSSGSLVQLTKFEGDQIRSVLNWTSGSALDTNPWLVSPSLLFFERREISGPRTYMAMASEDGSVTEVDVGAGASPTSNAEGTQVAVVATDGGSSDIELITIQTGARHPIASSLSSESSPKWSPVEDELLFKSGHQGADHLHVLSLGTDFVRRIDGTQGATDAIWTRSGDAIVFARFDGQWSQLVEIEADVGTVCEILLRSSGRISTIDCLSGGRILLERSHEGQTTLELLDRATGATTIVADTSASYSPSSSARC